MEKINFQPPPSIIMISTSLTNDMFTGKTSFSLKQQMRKYTQKRVLELIEELLSFCSSFVKTTILKVRISFEISQTV